MVVDVVDHLIQSLFNTVYNFLSRGHIRIPLLFIHALNLQFVKVFILRQAHLPPKDAKLFADPCKNRKRK